MPVAPIMVQDLVEFERLMAPVATLFTPNNATTLITLDLDTFNDVTLVPEFKLIESSIGRIKFNKIREIQKKMYVQFPNFEGFTNVAVCPSSSGMEGCYIADASENLTMYQKCIQDTFSYFPYLPGHFYFIYPCKNGKQLRPTKFKTENELFEHLKAYLGSL